jgi:hypothetical protein
MSKLETAFWLFHDSNPKVYTLLVKFAHEWREARGDKARLGMKALFERVRWETSLQTNDEFKFKLNNNHTAFYARLLMESRSELKGLFKLRKQKIESSIGPANDKLPEGGQTT